MKQINELTTQGWDLEIGDFDRLLVAITDMQNEIGDKIVGGYSQKSINELAKISSQIVDTIEKLPKDINKTLKLTLIQQDKLVGFLKDISETLSSMSTQKPEKIGQHIVNIGKEMGSSIATMGDSINAVLKANNQEVKEVVTKIGEIIDRPIPERKYPTWSFDIIRDYDTGLIKRIVAKPQ
jgi:hypothetical protein